MLQVTQDRAGNSTPAPYCLRPEPSVPATLPDHDLGATMRLAYNSLTPADQEQLALLLDRGIKRAAIIRATRILTLKDEYEKRSA